MIICVEGPDLSGKTTLIKSLSNSCLNTIVIKRGSIPESTGSFQPHTQEAHMFEAIRDHEKMFYAALELSKIFHVVIMDRWFPSEQVYSYTMRDYNSLNNKNNRAYKAFKKIKSSIDNVLQDFVFIQVDVPIETLKERHSLRGDDYVKEDKLLRIKAAYYTWTMLNTELNIIEFDPTKQKTKDLIGAINDITGKNISKTTRTD